MSEFQLDAQLARDCFVLGRLEFSRVLLMNNALAPWFILVPETAETELFALHAEAQVLLLGEITALSRYVQENFKVSKINVAAIGNIVRQLHIHVVGREPGDYCWPNVVWGHPGGRTYETNRVDEITASLREYFGERFVSS